MPILFLKNQYRNNSHDPMYLRQICIYLNKPYLIHYHLYKQQNFLFLFHGKIFQCLHAKNPNPTMVNEALDLFHELLFL